MVEAGLTQMQVIVSATGNGAKALKMDHIFGTIKGGLEADIIAVQEARAPLIVMQGGRVVF